MENNHWDAVENMSFEMSMTEGTAGPPCYGRPILSPLPVLPDQKPTSNKKYETKQIAFRCPTHFQQALQSLQQYPRSFIHAWLLMAKSLGLSAQSVRDDYQQGSALSIDQVQAIAMLQDLPHDQVLAWYGGGATDELGVEADDPCRHNVKEKEKRVSKRLSSKPLSDLIEGSEDEISPQAHPGIKGRVVDAPKISPQEAEKPCTYKCTGCSRTFKSMQTWSRHEKEDHEDISFPCMPSGAIEVTACGRTCALCGQEPTEEHLRSHNIERCTQLRHVFKRSDQLKQHLETHGLARKSRQSDLLVNKWQRVPNKKAWACGFCKALSSSLVDFHKHVAIQHYERGEDRKWDHTKVILGLLSQPHIAGPWERLLASQFRTRLELGQESGDELAQAALDCAIYDRDLLHEEYRRQEPSTLDLRRVTSSGTSGPPVPPKPGAFRPSSRVDNEPVSNNEYEPASMQPLLSLDDFKIPSPPLFDTSPRAWEFYMTHLDHLGPANDQHDINSHVHPTLLHQWQ
ncbi:MAG: hypothetical protein Q9166_005172 [cf. Caloplaca sp. 2 TL-2023]